MGIVLIVAAVLKAYELATVPLLGPDLLQQRWLLLCVIELELVFGGWLLFSLSARRTWTATLLLWLIFFLAAGYEAVTGAASCGCLGRVQVNPWFTTAFDLAVVFVLLFCRPAHALTSEVSRRLGVMQWIPLNTLAAAGLAFGIWNTVHVFSQKPTEDGFMVADGITVLEPEKWGGKPFLLAKYINQGPQFGQGDWLILLYRYDCEHCQQAVPRYDALANGDANNPNRLTIALIEIPPFAPPGQELYRPGTHTVVGRLSAEREWFASTPVAIRLHDGIVQQAVEGDAAINPGDMLKGKG